MGGVQLHRVEARLLDPPGGLGEQVDELEDLGDRRLADLLALLLRVLVDDLVARGPRQLEHPVGRAQRVVARDRALAPRVLELDGALRAVAVHRLGQAGEARARSCRRRPRGRSPSGGRSRHRAWWRPRSRSPVPPLAMLPWWWMSRSDDLAIRGGRADVRGHVDDPVGERDRAHLERAEQVREGHDNRLLAGRRHRWPDRPPPAPPRQCQSRSKEWQKRSRRPSRTVQTLHTALSDAAAPAHGDRHGHLRLAAGHGPGLPARGDRVHGPGRRGSDALARSLRDRAGARRRGRASCSASGRCGRSRATSSSSTTASPTWPSRTRAGRCACCWSCSARSCSPGQAAGRWTSATSRRSAGTSGPPRPGSAAAPSLADEIAVLMHRLRDIHVRSDPAERFLADATLRTAIALVNRDPAARATRQRHPRRRRPPGADPSRPRLRGPQPPRADHAGGRRRPGPRQPVPRPPRVQGRHGRVASRST